MKFEKQVEVMAKCWTHMLKTGVISGFINIAHPEKGIHFPTIDQNQENKLIETLKERFLNTINNNLNRFERNEPGLQWSLHASDITAGLQAANIIIKDLNDIQFTLHPHMYLNNCGEVSVNNGQGCHFIYYPDPSLQQRFFGKNYLQRLDEIYKDYFNCYFPQVAERLVSTNKK